MKQEFMLSLLLFNTVFEFLAKVIKQQQKETKLPLISNEKIICEIDNMSVKLLTKNYKSLQLEETTYEEMVITVTLQ